MKDYHINIFLSEEDGGYIADIRIWHTAQLLARHRRRLWAKFSRPSRLGSRPPGRKASPCPRLRFGQLFTRHLPSPPNPSLRRPRYARLQFGPNPARSALVPMVWPSRLTVMIRLSPSAALECLPASL